MRCWVRIVGSECFDIDGCSGSPCADGWFAPMWQHLGMVTSVAIAPMATKAPETSARLIITTIAPTTLAGPAVLAPMKASTASPAPVATDTLEAVSKTRVPWITVTIVRPGLAARVPMKG